MLYAGTSGYSFREWVGRFYPPRTSSKKYLSFYASCLNSVEINHTFRRFPRSELAASWAEQTPESFRFSVKMHQSVTHRARLKDVERSVEDFMRALAPLGARLGVVLFQLPPYFRANLERLEGFLCALPKGYRFAIEFRHDSWNQPAVVELLREKGVALCAAMAEVGETIPGPTASHGYVRVRRPPPYTREEVEGIRRQMQGFRERVRELYLYVKHDEGGRAPEVVLRLRSPWGLSQGGETQ